MKIILYPQLLPTHHCRPNLADDDTARLVSELNRIYESMSVLECPGNRRKECISGSGNIEHLLCLSMEMMSLSGLGYEGRSFASSCHDEIRSEFFCEHFPMFFYLGIGILYPLPYHLAEFFEIGLDEIGSLK